MFPNGEIVPDDDLLIYTLRESAKIVEDAYKNEVEKQQARQRLWTVTKIFLENKNLHKQLLSNASSIVKILEEPKEKSFFAFSVGSLMEQNQRYADAVNWYSEACKYKSSTLEIAYFSQNNLAFCFNILDRYREAELCCRRAISLDQERHNAYKNLGIALEAQNKYKEAAECYIKACILCPHDPRSFKCLQNLVSEQKYLLDFRNIEDGIEQYERVLHGISKPN